MLENFFAARHCPVRGLAREFLIAADKNGLDWRLLPSIISEMPKLYEYFGIIVLFYSKEAQRITQRIK